MAKKKKKKPILTENLYGELGVRPGGRGYTREERNRNRNSEIMKQLPDLAKNVNTHHQQVGTYARGFMEHALRCGKVLIEVKELLKQMKPDSSKRFIKQKGVVMKYPPRFQKWLKVNVDASYRTANDYMRLAKNWDGKLRKARARGVQIASVKAALKEIGEKLPKKGRKKPRTEKQHKKYANERDCLIEEFKEEILEELADFEIGVLLDGFATYFWPKWYGELRQTVCCVFGHSPYDKYDEEMDYGPDYKDSEEDLSEVKRKVRRKSRVTKKAKKSQTKKSKPAKSKR
jgi:putative sterol carrier protein